jgi:3-hydroxyacyl-CoA dehydrogenase/3a,7a,12a-trihydroxy-5b-cholest-24-enoyl-CoA hydratase
VLNFFDKGKGGLLEIEDTTYDKGEPICRTVGGIYIRGLGGFGGERGPSRDKENIPPQRAPDAVQEETTRETQAQIYRLSGDYNPLHIDPDLAQMVGFKKPILHGLCTYGYACRALIKAFAENDPSKMKSLRVRFANTVIPGDTLVTEMWDLGNGNIVFQT